MSVSYTHLNTGKVIIETLETRGINPVYTPGVLCTNHGPFTWGKDAARTSVQEYCCWNNLSVRLYFSPCDTGN